MSYKDEFQKLVNEQRLEDARVLLEENKTFAYDDSFYFANMGWVLNHIGRYQEGIPYLTKGIHTFPDDAWMYTQLGYSYNHTGNNEEAVKYLLKGLEMGHDEPWIHGEIGWAYRELQQPLKAVEYFENALLDDPDNVWLTAQAAFAYRDSGDKKNAEEYLQKVYFLSPDDDSLYDLVNFYKGEMRFEDEIAMLDKMKESQNLLWRKYEKAYACNRCNRYEEAKELLLECLQEGRDDTGVREELADAYRSMQCNEQAKEQYTIALGYYEKALERNDADKYWILQEMVWIAHKQDDPLLKLQYLDRLSQVKERDAWTMYHYAKAYANLNEFEKALEYCDKCIEIDGENEEICSLKAWLLGKVDKFEDALSLLKNLLAKGRKDCWVFNELGWDYSEINRHDKAITCYKNSLAMNAQDAWVLSQVAWNYGAIGKYEESTKWYKKAEEQGRKDGWLYANIGWNYTNLKQYKEAIVYFEKAQSLDYKEEWFMKHWKHAVDVVNGDVDEDEE